MKKILVIAALIVGTLMIATNVAGIWGTYNGLNKGVYVGSCGFEIVGQVGPFCNVD